MVKVAEGKLRKHIREQLGGAFERLVLEGRDGLTWTIQVEEHPETRAEVLLAEGEDRREVHPREQLAELLLRLTRQRGLVKHSYLFADGRRLRLDARYGRLKEQRLDAEALDKLSGGRRDLLRPDNAGALLEAIGILKPSGVVSARERKKLKQINDFLRQAQPLLDKLINRPRAADADPTLRLVDLACGNSYLAFALAWELERRGHPYSILGVDSREDLVARSRARAEQLGIPMRVLRADLRELEGGLAEAAGGPVSLAVSLHACDTATDAALIAAVGAGAEAILAAPCCQNELFRQLEGAPSLLCEQSLYRREFAATLTDALRAKALEARGYAVAVLEFTASLHTAKSLMIRAWRAHKPKPEAAQAFASACQAQGVQPSIRALLESPP